MSGLLDDYYDDSELCEEIGVKPRTTKQWRIERKGPPVTYIKGRPYYHKDSARQWLRSREGKGRAA
jgi:hypothetical protein